MDKSKKKKHQAPPQKFGPRVKTALRLPPSAQAEIQLSALFPGKRAEIYFPPPFRPCSGKNVGNYKIRPGQRCKKSRPNSFTLFLYLVLAFFLLDLIILDPPPPIVKVFFYPFLLTRPDQIASRLHPDRIQKCIQTASRPNQRLYPGPWGFSENSLIFVGTGVPKITLTKPSLITHHSLLISHQPSLVSHHPSLINYHPSTITHRPSPITRYPSLITHHPLHITQNSELIIYPPLPIFSCGSMCWDE